MTKLIELLKDMTDKERLACTEWLRDEKNPLATRLYVGLNHFTKPDYKLMEETLDILDSTLLTRLTDSCS